MASRSDGQDRANACRRRASVAHGIVDAEARLSPAADSCPRLVDDGALARSEKKRCLMVACVEPQRRRQSEVFGIVEGGNRLALEGLSAGWPCVGEDNLDLLLTSRVSVAEARQSHPFSKASATRRAALIVGFQPGHDLRAVEASRFIAAQFFSFPDRAQRVLVVVVSARAEEFPGRGQIRALFEMT